jgi:guanylate kinase
MSGNISILTGPSGVGKTTVGKQLLQTVPNLHKLVTCTTRKPRTGERDGRDYHFLSSKKFLSGVKRGDFFEWANVYGQLYGNRKKELSRELNHGYDVLFVVDVQGAKKIKKLRPDADVIFLTAPSQNVLESRIKKRGAISAEELKKRFASFKKELAFAKKADLVVENKEGHLPKTIEKILTKITRKDTVRPTKI